MPVLEIRTAVEADLPRLRDLFRDSSWSNEGDRAVLTEHPEFLELAPDAVLAGRTRVAAADGHIVGFVTIADVVDGLEIMRCRSTRGSGSSEASGSHSITGPQCA